MLISFGLPAVAAAFIGAAVLMKLSAQGPMFSWSLGSRMAEVTPVKLVMGILILGFAGAELAPRRRSLRASPRWLPLGGAISGFFGGLSGHQGAFRAAFLRAPSRATTSTDRSSPSPWRAHSGERFWAAGCCIR